MEPNPRCPNQYVRLLLANTLPDGSVEARGKINCTDRYCGLSLGISIYEKGENRESTIRQLLSDSEACQEELLSPAAQTGISFRIHGRHYLKF